LLVLLACVAMGVSSASAAHHRRSPHHAAVVHVRTHGTPAARKRARLAGEHARILRMDARVVMFARRLLGVPYVYAGASPAGGFDCSGFTRYVFAHFGVRLPHYTFAQFDLGRTVARSGLRPGDLVFFDDVAHVGLYIGHNRFIHAPHSGSRVSVARLSGWYSGTFAGARRVIA
jgi:cell wall-associated NlpC family hydrolase